MKEPSFFALAILLALLSFSVQASQPKFAGNFMANRSFSFQPNKGQLADEHGKLLPDVLYYRKDKGVSIYCFRDHIAFVFTRILSSGHKEKQPLNTCKHTVDNPRQNDSIQAARLEMQFANTNPEVSVVADAPQPVYSNYYLPQCPKGIIVNSFKRLTYKNIYPKIDLQLDCQDKGMEYSFIVYPGGDVNAIRMQWSGADSLLQQEGSIRYACGLGFVQENGLKSYLSSGQPLNVSYAVQGNSVAFNVPDYDKGKVLTIDPILVWGTYFGGSKGDEAYGIQLHDSDFFVSGQTQNATGIATSGAYQTSFGGSGKYNFGDAFVTRFSLNGNEIWSTYFGGSAGDIAWGTVTDDSGNVYFIGQTESSNNIASSGAYQTVLGGDYDAFITKLAYTGKLLWSTYFGGYYGDYAYGIAIDHLANVIITGSTGSYSGIATPGSYQANYGGDGDAFLAKFSPTGGLLWSTYFGGENEDLGRSVALDDSDNIFLTGFADSYANIATTGAYQSKLGGNALPGDAFIAKFSPSGKRMWSTYYGGKGNDEAYGIKIDASNNLYIGGFTSSDSAISTPGVYKTYYSKSINSFYPKADAFLVKFTSDGKRLWGTYFGGTGEDECLDLSLNSLGNILVAGWTSSTSGIAGSGAYQSTFGGEKDTIFGGDGFLAEFFPNGKLSWSTYYGGNNDDEVIKIAANKITPHIFIAGYTSSNKSISTSGSFQSSYGGGSFDAFIARFTSYQNDAGITSLSYIPNDRCKAIKKFNATIKNYGTNEIDSVDIIWSVNNRKTGVYTWKGKLAVDSIIDVTLGSDSLPAGVDTVRAWTSRPNGQQDSVPENDTASIIILVYPLPAAHTGPPQTICDGDSVKIGGALVKENTYSWTSKPAGFTSVSSQPVVKPSVTTIYYLTETANITGCSRTDSVTVRVNPLPGALVGGDKQVCEGDSVQLGKAAVAGHSYHWTSQPPGFSSNLSAVTIGKDQLPGTVFYKLTETIDSTGCSKTDSARVTVVPLPAAATGKNKDICLGDSTTIGDSNHIVENSYSWISRPAGFTSSANIAIVKPAVTTTYYLTEANHRTGCSKTDSVTISVYPLPIAKAGRDTTICPGQSVLIGDSAAKGYAYSWTSMPVGFVSSVASALVHPDTSTVYYLTVTNVASCKDQDSVVISVAKPYISGTRDICLGDVTLFSTPYHSGSVYSWTSKFGRFNSDSSKDSVYMVWNRACIDTIKVIESNRSGCVHFNKFVVNVHALPSAAWTAVQSGKTFTFRAKTAGLQSYKWVFGDGVSDTGFITSHTYAHDSTYSVGLMVSSVYGCMSDKDSAIKVLTDTLSPDFWYKIYPNPFTDELTVKYNLPDNERIQAVLYDERGRLIISLMDQQQSAGIHYFKLNGEAYSLASAVYYMRIIFGERVIVAPVIRISDQ